MSNETIREDYSNATQLENHGEATLIESQQQNTKTTYDLKAGSKFREYNIVKQLPSTSTEADIFVIEKESKNFFLKLYRFGIDPKIEILKSIQSLGEKYPDNFINQNI